MTTQEFTALVDFIDALIDKKIGDAFGRDSLHESIRLSEFEKELKALLVDEDDAQ